MCLLAKRTFVLSSQEQLGINLQAASTVIERRHCSRLHLPRSRVPGVRALGNDRARMRIRVYLYVFSVPWRSSFSTRKSVPIVFSVPWRSSFSTRKKRISGTSIHEMIGMANQQKLSPLLPISYIDYTSNVGRV